MENENVDMSIVQWPIFCVMMHAMYNFAFTATDVASKILLFLKANYLKYQAMAELLNQVFKVVQWLLEQVFVAVKKWENCIYFQRKLHLCAVSCIYAHNWLRKTWPNLFSFARTWPKAKIFRTSTSNGVRALSYLAGVVKLLACKSTVSS